MPQMTLSYEDMLHRLGRLIAGSVMWDKLWARSPERAVRTLERRIAAERHQLMAFWLQLQEQTPIKMRLKVRRRR